MLYAFLVKRVSGGSRFVLSLALIAPAEKAEREKAVVGVCWLFPFCDFVVRKCEKEKCRRVGSKGAH